MNIDSQDRSGWIIKDLRDETQTFPFLPEESTPSLNAIPPLIPILIIN